ncbi:MAG: DUF3791 domain-containing protein [Clostridium sp.]
MDIYNKSGVIDLLTDGYELLHTQGKDYVIDEIEVDNKGIDKIM